MRTRAKISRAKLSRAKLSRAKRSRRALLAFGANLGDRHAQWQEATRLLASESVQILAASSLFETSPVGGPEGQDVFLNAALSVQTTLTAIELIDRLLAVELEIGRIRETRWGARLVDLDLLLFENEIIEQPSYTVPHPRMTFRRFMLEPALEVAAHWQHPITQCSLADLVATLNHRPQSAEIWCTAEALELQHTRVQAPGLTPKPTGSLAVSSLVHQLERSGFAVSIPEPAGDKWEPGPHSERPTLSIVISKLAHPPMKQVRGPYLMLPAESPEQWDVELAAAMEAMA